MLKAMRLLSFPAIAAVLIVYCSPIYPQVYSYVDANGVRVFTNIAPIGPVSDLKISGAPPAPPAPSPAVAKKNRVADVKGSEAARVNAAGSGKGIPAKGVPGSSVRGVAPGAASPVPSAPPAVQSDAITLDYDAIIKKYASEYDLDPNLIHSMIATESGFDSKAVSPKGAQGLMQLMPETASRLGVRNAFDPEQNIWGGTRYMRFLLDTFSDSPKYSLMLSLAAYNAGENLVQRLGRVPNIRETNDYVRSVILRYGKTEMEKPDIAPARITGPSTFYYFNQNGVLFLTNIPPVDRSGSAKPTGGTTRVFR